MRHVATRSGDSSKGESTRTRPHESGECHQSKRRRHVHPDTKARAGGNDAEKLRPDKPDAVRLHGPRGGWRRDASRPRRLPQPFKRKVHAAAGVTRFSLSQGEPHLLSGREQTHAQRAEGESGWGSRPAYHAQHGRRRRVGLSMWAGGQIVKTRVA